MVQIYFKAVLLIAHISISVQLFNIYFPHEIFRYGQHGVISYFNIIFMTLHVIMGFHIVSM